MDEQSREAILVAWRSPLRLDAQINSPPASEEALSRFESEFGPIPPPFRWFLSACGGGPVGSEWVDDIAALAETHRWFHEEFREVQNLFVIGRDGRGDPFGIERVSGRLLGVDHDNGEIYERAPSFESFLMRGLADA